MRGHATKSSRNFIREIRRGQAVVHRFGLSNAFRNARKYPARLLTSRIGYWRYRRLYPSNVIFMASLPKSGSTWLANMLAELPGFSRYQPAGWTASFLDSPNQDIYPGLFEEVARQLVVIKGHTQGTPENAARLGEGGRRYLLTVRDPRDQLISGYWYLRNRPLHPSHSLAMKLAIDEFISHELDPTTVEIRRSDWIRTWLENRDRDLSLLVRYEDLLADPAIVLGQIFSFFDFEVNQWTINAMIDNNSFVKTSGRSPGEEDQSAFLRRGTAGEWKELFSQEQKEIFASQMEDLVLALGYEPTIGSRRG